MDHIFGFGPSGPLIRTFGDVHMNSEGQFLVRGHPVQVAFDDEEHKREMLGRLKLHPKESAIAGFVDYLIAAGTKRIRILAQLCGMVEESQTSFDRLGSSS